QNQFLKSSFSGNGLRNEFDERFNSHDAEVFISPGTHGNSTSCTLLLASDKDERQLLHGMLTYFIRNLLVAQVKGHPNRVLGQGFSNFFSNFATVITLGVRDIEHRNLHRRK